MLVRAPNWLGDAVMALPALEAVRRAFAGRTMILAATAVDRADLRGAARRPRRTKSSTIDRAREAAAAEGGAGRRRAAADELVRQRLAGQPQRRGRALGLPRGRPRLAAHARRRDARAARVHQVEYYLELVRGARHRRARDRATAAPPDRSRATATASTGPTRFWPRAGCRLPGATIVGFAPGAAYGHAKRWPPDRVAQVIAALSRRGVAAVMVGAGADRDTGRAIESSLPPDARVVEPDRAHHAAAAGRGRGAVRRVRVERLGRDAHRRGAAACR